MRQASLIRPASQLLCHISAARTVASSVSESISDVCARGNSSARFISAASLEAHAADLTRSYRTFAGFEGRNIEPVRFNVKGSRSLSAYRRDPSMHRRESEEDTANIDLDPAKMLEKGSPGTYQAIVRDVMPVGYFLTMPSGREAYLPATDIGTTGGVLILEKIFKVGQELTVRITSSIPKRDIVSIKKEGMEPEIAKRGFGRLGGGTTGGTTGSSNPRNRP